MAKERFMKSIDIFKSLDDMEKEHLTALPIYITALIAGADGTVDHAELKRAVSFSKLATSSQDECLTKFYSDVNQDFEDKLKMVMANLPCQKEDGKKFLVHQIGKANVIFKKLDQFWAAALYSSFKELAKNIASASGGILGFGSISGEESQLIDLTMIQNPSL